MPAVLIAGLDPSAPEALRSINADALRKLLNEAEKKVHAAGYDAKVLYIFPKDGVEHFKKALEEKEWDTVMIGVSEKRKNRSILFLLQIPLSRELSVE